MVAGETPRTRLASESEIQSLRDSVRWVKDMQIYLYLYDSLNVPSSSEEPLPASLLPPSHDARGAPRVVAARYAGGMSFAAEHCLIDDRTCFSGDRTVTETTTHTLDVPGAVLTYDVRANGNSDEPPLMLIGSPMGAAGFGSLSKFLPGRTIITYDPRGAERSTKTDVSSPVDPHIHADDISRVIDAVGEGPVDLFATSGGAVNALALVTEHPEQVRTLVAHEPPLASQLPDREAAEATVRAIQDSYRQRGWGAGMAHFIAVVSHRGEFDDDFARQPGPDPQMFGMPVDDNGDRTDVMLGQNLITCTHFEPDYDALRHASTRIVLAAGEDSQGEMANRGAYAVAERLGTTPVVFPSDHGGFMGGEYGQQPGKPEEFAAKLQGVLAPSS
jgi:pimeloyl-ACP methyl ester carboxylesterase